MGKPFSDLEKRAIALIAVQPDYMQWPDEELRKYWAWKIRADKASHNLPAASERPNGRKLSEVYLQPFGMTLPGSIYARVGISKRSFDAKTNQGLTDAVLGHNPIGSGVSLPLKKYRPARVYYRTGDATTSVARISRITGRSYKSYYSAGDEGYSIPFGKVGTDTEAQRQQAIKTAIGDDINLITFTSEKLSI